MPVASLSAALSMYGGCSNWLPCICKRLLSTAECELMKEALDLPWTNLLQGRAAHFYTECSPQVRHCHPKRP